MALVRRMARLRGEWSDQFAQLKLLLMLLNSLLEYCFGVFQAKCLSQCVMMVLWRSSLKG